jgi:hypothetical protein
MNRSESFSLLFISLTSLIACRGLMCVRIFIFWLNRKLMKARVNVDGVCVHVSLSGELSLKSESLHDGELISLSRDYELRRTKIQKREKERERRRRGEEAEDEWRGNRWKIKQRCEKGCFSSISCYENKLSPRSNVC